MPTVNAREPSVSGRRLLPCVLALGAVFLSVGVGRADFLIPAVGPGTGFAGIEHAVYATAPGGALPVFAPPILGRGTGQMQQPGLFFPRIIQPPLAQNDPGIFPLVANVPETLITPPTLGFGFGGATTTLVGVAAGGRGGVVATDYTLFDNTVNGFAVANTFGADVDYLNVGPGFNARFGHFVSGIGVSPPDGYFAAGVISTFEVDFQGGVGQFFTPDASFSPPPLVFVFGADVGLTETFWGVTAGNLFVPAGASVRMRGTVTLVGDPGASIVFAPLPDHLLPDVLGLNLGFGAASNGAELLGAVPEPSAALLVGLGALLAWPLLCRLKRCYAGCGRSEAT